MQPTPIKNVQTAPQEQTSSSFLPPIRRTSTFGLGFGSRQKKPRFPISDDEDESQDAAVDQLTFGHQETGIPMNEDSSQPSMKPTVRMVRPVETEESLRRASSSRSGPPIIDDRPLDAFEPANKQGDRDIDEVHLGQQEPETVEHESPVISQVDGQLPRSAVDTTSTQPTHPISTT
ncbi:hypothetical protein G7Y89_g11277 [Cudoniella acicularis]|uniref:Uncharacterized protein n=1 Tax=Cudoniella acicularis TaxID=354080 RepID=A0A8H4W094_9HELO|nr:hypothetical protein G7Y89_g11277 [Cudoniella acicularis]